ncbi:glutamate--tRNA ligase [bacterium]|nr:glutamate--tRNA ligase [bacterium]
MTEIVVRFAPSPTGSLHIGGARTALYNWLYARHTSGKFLLRIEDTDAERSTGENVRVILDGLSWLGLDWDGEPIYQSRRIDAHKVLIDKMLSDGTAYRCTCTKEELAEKREAAQAAKQKYTYDRKCRDANHGTDAHFVVRIKMPIDGEIVVDDLILGRVAFPAEELDDWIVARADGLPTYNFVVVADDHDMRVTHVIRGVDHLNNTPKQLIVYKALGFDVPAFAHIPLVHGPDGKKLSKRHGATSLTEFAKLGFMPAALRNYLARLGWSHGDKELFADEELIALFDVKDVNPSAAIMDMDKLAWVNQQKMMTLPESDVVDALRPYLAARGYPEREQAWLEKLVVNTRERFKNLAELADHVRYFFEDPAAYDEKAKAKFLNVDGASILAEIADGLDALADFAEPEIEQVFKTICEARNLALGKVAQPARVALTGGTVSPGIFETIALIGKETALRRIRAAAAVAR